jgi:DnaJ-domain-containing protein 1
MGRVLLLLIILICAIFILRALGSLLKAFQAQLGGGQHSARRSSGGAAGDSKQNTRQQSSSAQRKGKRTFASERECREVLGVAAGASEQEIKAAYRAQLARYHPDKVTHLGAEFSELAAQRTREIIDAYEYLKSFHGFR